MDPRGTLGDILWRHRAAESRPAPRAAAAPGAAADVGEIAVIQDDGSLVAPPNAFDLQGTGLRFAPRAGGYDVSRIDPSFQAAIGDPVSLQDDDSTSRTLAFAFTFYGVPQSTAFINSDGNITFVEEDRASTARSIGRLLSGPPRVRRILRRSRSLGRRCRLPPIRVGCVHRDLVWRAGVRLAQADDVSGVALAGRHD